MTTTILSIISTSQHTVVEAKRNNHYAAVSENRYYRFPIKLIAKAIYKLLTHNPYGTQSLRPLHHS